MSVIFEPISTGTGAGFLISLAVACVCGLLCAGTSALRSRISKSFFICLSVLPMIVSAVILMVNGNVGTGIAVAGAFSLVRFRSVPGKARDIAAIFLAMTAGLACGAGYVAVAVILCAAVCGVMILLTLSPVGDSRAMELHITIPESLNICGAFEDLFESYTKTHRLVRTKTSGMGSLYKLLYHIEMKDPTQIQSFIDQLRCRNGNLEIAINEIPEGSEVL